MNESKISVRYAKAIVEHAREENILDAVKTDFDMIYRCIDQIPELKLLLYSPIIKTSEKLTIIKNSMGNNVNRVTLSFLTLVFSNKREAYLASISRYIAYLYNKEMGIKPGILLTPTHLESSIKDKIINLISHKLNIKIELSEKTNKSLLGGFILRIEDQQIDASVASQLTKIRKGLTN